MVATTLLHGFAAGIAATGVMALTEFPAWRKWGLISVLEWHENQALSARLLGGPPQKLLLPGLLLHFLHGGLAGMAFLLALEASGLASGAPVLGLGFGIVLWLIGLAIHEPVTGVRPWRHPRGRLPAMLSLAGHVVYGTFLGLLAVWL